MKFSFYRDDISRLSSDLLVLGIFEDFLEAEAYFPQLDKALEGLLSRVVKEEDFKGKEEQVLLLHTHNRLGISRVALLGLGKRTDFQIADTRKYGASAVQLAEKAGSRTVALALPSVDSTATGKTVQFLVEGTLLGRYRFERYKTKESRAKGKIESVKILIPPGETAPGLHVVSRAEIIARAVILARDLVNEPACQLTPQKLAEIAQSLAKEKGLACKVLGPKECERLKMNLFLAVSQGSVEEPRFIHLTYKPKGKEKSKKRLVLIGKGVTFDSGGLSLKQTQSMVDMKTDMAGAAALLGVVGALPDLGLAVEVHVIIAATENMISGSAYKLGDVFVGLAGKSVEIVNTDAEGRLTLADALAYGAKFSPDEIVDLATLTGACMVPL